MALVESNATIVKYWATMLTIIHNLEKTSFSLKNFLVGGWSQYKRYLKVTKLATIYLLLAPLPKRYYKSQGFN